MPEFWTASVNSRAIKYSGFLKKWTRNFSLKDKREAKKKLKNFGVWEFCMRQQQYACVEHQSMTLYKSLKLFSLLS